VPHMMDDFPLLLSTLYERAVRIFPDQEIVSVESDRSIIRQTYAETDDRVRRLATALERRLGVEPGTAVGTFAWNNRRHHELYWATANTGRICHTINIRLFPEQITYIVNHAGDRAVFVDPDLVPLLEPIADTLEGVRAFVVMGDSDDTRLPNGAIAYEDLIEDAHPHGPWPLLDERSPMMFCYTSGTTGNPKGVAYTQRSTYLHTISNLAAFHIGPETTSCRWCPCSTPPPGDIRSWRPPRGPSSPTRGPTFPQGLVPLVENGAGDVLGRGAHGVARRSSTISRSIPRRTSPRSGRSSAADRRSRER
jgi:acyl-CoA synthetase (AMP-forming)/AMP-acid ligase II